MLSEDLITLLSNSNWNMKEIYSEEFGNSAVPTNLTKAFIDSFPDFGLTGALLQRKETNKKRRSAFNSNQFLEANHAFNEKSEGHTKNIQLKCNFSWFRQTYS